APASAIRHRWRQAVCRERRADDARVRVTKTIPIVFGIGEDPVEAGLVPSLNRPPGNMTGVTFLSAGLGAKRLGMLRQLVPDADVMSGLLANQNSPQGQEQMQDVADAAKSLGQQSQAVGHAASARP